MQDFIAAVLKKKGMFHPFELIDLVQETEKKARAYHCDNLPRRL